MSTYIDKYKLNRLQCATVSYEAVRYECARSTRAVCLDVDLRNTRIRRAKLRTAHVFKELPTCSGMFLRFEYNSTRQNFALTNPREVKCEGTTLKPTSYTGVDKVRCAGHEAKGKRGLDSFFFAWTLVFTFELHSILSYET